VFFVLYAFVLCLFADDECSFKLSILDPFS